MSHVFHKDLSSSTKIADLRIEAREDYKNSLVLGISPTSSPATGKRSIDFSFIIYIYFIQVEVSIDLLSIYPEVDYFEIYLELFELEILFRV
jgi:hypothetical protein